MIAAHGPFEIERRFDWLVVDCDDDVADLKIDQRRARALLDVANDNALAGAVNGEFLGDGG